jgi:hypothetical protein
MPCHRQKKKESMAQSIRAMLPFVSFQVKATLTSNQALSMMH